jgi:hypothetical protein
VKWCGRVHEVARYPVANLAGEVFIRDGVCYRGFGAWMKRLI